MKRFILNRRAILKGSFAAFISLMLPTKTSAKTPAFKGLVTNRTTSSITLLVSTNTTGKFYVEYGTNQNNLLQKTGVSAITPSSGKKVSISGFQPNTNIYYRVRYLVGKGSKYLSSEVASIKTFQILNSEVFAIQADPHMDQNSSEEVYVNTLNQIVMAAPAFLMDLGDIFMVDKLPDKSEVNIRGRFELMKKFYGLLNNVPLKITLGNHDGELGYSKFNTKNFRKEYFPEQTGDVAYYSFTGPNQLHIVLDPFTYTVENPKDDGWQWTLGKTQYDWLEKSLAEATQEHKFIYIHHLLVGNAQSRGGVEIAHRNEWGGKNIDGTYGFDTQRQGWGKPIHDLLVQYKVGFVFKGHDHLYVKQELDGIIYQTVPQPSHPGDKLDVTQYGYLSGRGVGGSGFLKVRTRDKTVFVDFIKHDGSVADSYSRDSL
jgi:hypothetical protein